jgi:hypothetical protein
MDHGTQQRTVRRGLPGIVMPFLVLAALTLPLAGATALILSHSATSPRWQSVKRGADKSLRRPCCNRKMPIRRKEPLAGQTGPLANQSAKGDSLSGSRECPR